MALTRVNLTQLTTATGFGTGAATTGSFTPANSSLLVVVASAMQRDDTGMEGTDLTITDSAGLTWTSRAATTGSPAWSYGARLWTAPVTTGASMTVSVDCGAFFIEIYRIEVYEYTDYDTTTPVGGTIVGTDADGDGAANIVLSSAPASTSEVIARATMVLNSGTTTVAPGTGWTELFDISNATGFITSQTQVRSGSTSTSVDWNDLNDGAGSPAGAVLLAVEIRQAPGGGGPVADPITSCYPIYL